MKYRSRFLARPALASFPTRRLTALAAIALNLAVASVAPSTFGAAPPNDTCAGAEVIPSAGPFPYFATNIADIRTATGTGDPAAPTCATETANHGVWYKFTPNATRRFTFSVCADSGTTAIDTLIAIYRSSNGACGGSLTEVACSDDECDAQAAASVTLTSNVTYFIVAGTGVLEPIAPNTALRLRVSTPEVPANDTCAGALVIPPSGPFPYTAPLTDITLATEAGDPTPPACAPPALRRGVWYRFTPAEAGEYIFSTAQDTATTVLDTTMAIYTSANNCVGPFTTVACNDSGFNRAVIRQSLAAGTTYYVLVWEATDEPVIFGETLVELKISQVRPPQIVTLPPTNITSRTATLPALVNPNAQPTTVWFEWGNTTNYGNVTGMTNRLAGGTNREAVSATIGNLLAGTTYHFRGVASNVFGIVRGESQSFVWSRTRPMLTNPRVLPDGRFTAQFVGSPGQRYLLVATNALAGNPSVLLWPVVGPAIELGAGRFSVTDTNGVLSQRLYGVFAP